ncbi:type II toxin-antitoxin system RelB family antitoxin [Candidatus Palauibacter sp.]|uniref:type II toxin-antitoxin system RelB family antitoxin n=1 Tax=Candidatus Palauibacter sp. TaxID=3101350 RepID=UPI003CC68D42
MLSIQLPREIEARLGRLAKKTGRTMSDCACEAILEKIEDMEDAYLAEQVLDRIRKGEEGVVSAEDMWRHRRDAYR